MVSWFSFVAILQIATKIYVIQVPDWMTSLQCVKTSQVSQTQTLFIIHVSAINVKVTRSEELLQIYRRMTSSANKTNNDNIVTSGILPQVGVAQIFYDKAFCNNNILKSPCHQENVQFLN